jgi:hypothetical protein
MSMAMQKNVRSRAGRLFLGFVLAFSGLGLSACDEGNDLFGLALSLKPFYTDADLDFDPALAGSWTDTEDNVTFTFEQAEGKQYKLVVKETDDDHVFSTDFEAHLLRLDGDWFLDLVPDSGQAGSTFYQMHLLRAHSIARIEMSRDSMKMSFFEGTWVQKKIDAKSDDISFQKADGTLLLTGTSEEVRDLILQAAHDDGGFSDAITLDRQEVQP